MAPALSVCCHRLGAFMILPCPALQRALVLHCTKGHPGPACGATRCHAVNPGLPRRLNAVHALLLHTQARSTLYVTAVCQTWANRCGRMTPLRRGGRPDDRGRGHALPAGGVPGRPHLRQDHARGGGVAGVGRPQHARVCGCGALPAPARMAAVSPACRLEEALRSVSCCARRCKALLSGPAGVVVCTARISSRRMPRPRSAAAHVDPAPWAPRARRAHAAGKTVEVRRSEAADARGRTPAPADLDRLFLGAAEDRLRPYMRLPPMPGVVPPPPPPSKRAPARRRPRCRSLPVVSFVQDKQAAMSACAWAGNWSSSLREGAACPAGIACSARAAQTPANFVPQKTSHLHMSGCTCISRT
jgi:hypothetical protein